MTTVSHLFAFAIMFAILLVLAGFLGLVAVGCVALFVKNRKREWMLKAGLLPVTCLVSFVVSAVVVNHVATWFVGVDAGISDSFYIPLPNDYQMSFIDVLERGWISNEKNSNSPGGITKIFQDEEVLYFVTGNEFTNSGGKIITYSRLDTKTNEIISYPDEAAFLKAKGDGELLSSAKFYFKVHGELMKTWNIVTLAAASFFTIVAAIFVWKGVEILCGATRLNRWLREKFAKSPREI